MNLTIRSRHCVHLSWLSLLCVSTFPTTRFTGSQCTSFCRSSSCFCCCCGGGGGGGDGGGGDVLKTIFINISCITKLYNKVVQQSSYLFVDQALVDISSPVSIPPTFFRQVQKKRRITILDKNDGCKMHSPHWSTFNLTFTAAVAINR